MAKVLIVFALSLSILCDAYIVRLSRVHSKALASMSDQQVANLLSTIQTRLAETAHEPVHVHYDSREELSALMDADLHKSSNYWTDSRERIKRIRLAGATGAISPAEARQKEDAYFDAMRQGFFRRVHANTVGIQTVVDANGESSMLGLPVRIATQAAVELELGAGHDEMLDGMLQELKRKDSVAMKLLPKSTHSFIRYVRSLYLPPTSVSGPIRNFLIGSAFAAVLVANTGQRSRMFAIFGNLALATLLVTRNMPTPNTPPWMERTTGGWSLVSFITAVGLVCGFSGPVSLSMWLILRLVPAIPPAYKSSIAMSVGILSASIAISYFEVYESARNGGRRWEVAQRDTTSETLEKNLVNNLSEGLTTEEYSFAFDPDVNDDEVLIQDELKISDEDAKKQQKLLDSFEEMRDSRASKLYESERGNFRALRLDSKFFDCEEDAEDGSAPEWRNVFEDRYARYAKEERPPKDFRPKPVSGPFAFRDKSPEWVEEAANSAGENEEKRREIARKYGVYRKYMWKKDPLVVLQPCDGVKVETNADGELSVADEF